MLGASGLAEKLNFSSTAVLQVGTENELYKFGRLAERIHDIS